MALANFYRGLREKYSPDTHKDGFFFSTDTLEIILNGSSFGGGLTNVEFSEGKLIFSFANGTTKEVPIDEATLTLPGLLSALDKLKLDNLPTGTEISEDISSLEGKVGTNDYSGTNYLDGETNVTDAVKELDTLLKTSNDSLASINQEAVKEILLDGIKIDPTGNTVNIPLVSLSADGVMSSEDKAALDALIGDGEGSVQDQIKTALEDYLPLSGGTMTGNITFKSAPDSNGHEYVDLGLPSGNLWAKCNIGANTEEEGGLYFQWGDTQGYTAEQVGNGGGQKAFSWADYKFSIDGSSKNFSKYNASDSKTVLDPEDDAAHVNMGGNWRMPTLEEYKELCLNTDIYLVPTEGEEIQGTVPEQYVNVTINWVSQAEGTLKGVKFYKKGDKQTYLFVPTSGSALIGSVQRVGEGCYLWTSSSVSSDVRDAWRIGFQARFGDVDDVSRCNGISVRGILSSNTENSKGIIIEGKSETDLLNAGGSTTSISDITTQVQAAIVDSAPETLDTLNELAAALGDDPNFATTVTNQLAQKISTINASGTSPLTLSANKSGTTVNLTGSIASGKISANPIALTNQDLNDYNDISHVGYYYAGGNNTVTNKPSGVDSFGMVILRTASGILKQILFGNGASNEIYYRETYSSGWSSWKRVASTEDLDNYATTEALTSGLAEKANSTHTHGVADISGLSNVATSGSYNDLDDTPTIATSSQDGLMSAADKTKLDTIIDCVRIIGDDTKTGSFAVRPPDGTTLNYTLSIYPATTISTTTRASFGMIGNDPLLYLTVYDTSDNEHIVFTVPNDTGVLTINSGLSIPGLNLTISGSGSQTIDSTASRWLSLFNGLTGTQQRGIIFQKSGSSGSENVLIQRSINGALSGGILRFNIDNGQTEFFTQCNFTSLIRGTAGNWSINTDGAANFLSTVTASAFYQSSDRNSKDNITAITDEDIEKVKNVELVSYNFENDTTKRYGVVAQEVEEAGLTNLVHTDTKDKKTVDYISLLILKIEQLQKEVNELKSKVYGG